MREIKFRAWDEQALAMSKPFYPLNGEVAEVFGYPVSINHTTFLQYTGLKDKNGKEIYIEDLYRDEDGDIFKVIQMECGRFALQMISNNYINEFIDWNETEIIGNIYENPELINK